MVIKESTEKKNFSKAGKKVYTLDIIVYIILYILYNSISMYISNVVTVLKIKVYVYLYYIGI